MLSALLKREWRLLCASRVQLLTLASYPLLLLLVGALALDLPQQGVSVRVALLLIAFILLPLGLIGSAWRDDLQSGALVQLRPVLLGAVWARYAAYLFGVMLPLTFLLLMAGDLLLNLQTEPLILPLLLALPSLTGLLLLVAALLPGAISDQNALSALLLLPLLVPVLVLLVLATTGPTGLSAAAIWWLAALVALGFGLLPPAITAVLRHKLAS